MAAKTKNAVIPSFNGSLQSDDYTPGRLLRRSKYAAAGIAGTDQPSGLLFFKTGDTMQKFAIADLTATEAVRTLPPRG